MFLNTLDSPTRLLFQRLGREPIVASFFLAGGSALALQLGHRISLDLDFFSLREYAMQPLLNRLQTLGRLTIATQSADSFVGELNHVKLSFFAYPYPLLNAAVLCEGVQLASALDIALMKIAAIGQRGRKRDFVDLYFLLQQGFTLTGLLQQMPQKFPEVIYPSYHLIRALTYFDDAEPDDMPTMLKRIEWKTVRAFFDREVNRLLKAI